MRKNNIRLTVASLAAGVFLLFGQSRLSQAAFSVFSPNFDPEPFDSLIITVTPLETPMETSESGGVAQFSVVLAGGQPTTDVTINVSSSDLDEGTVDLPQLVFTNITWDTPQTVTVTGINDFIDDGDAAFTVILAMDPSSDPIYSTEDPSDVSVTNLDNDTAGVTVTPTSGLETTEAGGMDTFTVMLNSEPTGDVTIAVSSTDTGEGTVDTGLLTFTPGNWNSAQIVTVTGVNDFVDDGDIAYTITLAAANGGGYTGINPDDVSVTNLDNDTAGVTVTPTSGLGTTEAGGTDTFTVVLNSEPTGDVTIGVSSSDSGEGTASTVQLTFTTANWDDAQTVTVTGANDDVDDGDQVYNIVLAAAVGGGYTGINPADVQVTNADDDTAGVTVSVTGGSTVTTEAGGADTFTVVLTSEPTDDVTIAVSSTETGEGTVSTGLLTFTPANWDTVQTVTVTGVNDFVDDGDNPYTIDLAEASSTDPLYDVIDPQNVSATNTDDDTAGITVTPTSGLTTTEAGGTDTFTVVLNSQPTASVTIGVSSSDSGEGVADTSQLTFTTANWSTPQTIVVTGQGDVIIDGNIAYTINLAPASGGDYSGLDPDNVSVTNNDNDVAGFSITPTVGLTTTEAGGTDSFTVVLNSQPSANVVVGVSSSDTAEGTISPTSLTFTPGDWNSPHEVTITGQNDDFDDGDQGYTVILAAATSTDGNYSGLNPDDPSVTNVDDDTAGFLITPATGLTVTEGGGTDSFTVELTSEPTDSVSVAVSSSDLTEGTVDTANLNFNSANWDNPHTITISGVDDPSIDGDVNFSIILAAAVSADPNYNGRNPDDVGVTNTDDDIAGITVTPTGGLVTTESGGTAQFTVVLNTQPSSDVTIGLSSSNGLEGSVSPTSLVFTNGNWNSPRTVTITGQDDFVDDGNIAYTIVTAAATSSDANYNGINPSDVGVSNTDNDTAGVTVTPTSGLETSESGGMDTFTVMLNSEPTANVTIAVSSTDTGEGTVDTGLLTFTPGNWNSAQIVTVTGVNDFVDDGDIAYTITLAAANGGGYTGINPDDVSVTNLDNDTAGVTVTPTSGLGTTESGGTDTFTVVLNSEPTGDVTIGVSSSDSGEGTASTVQLTFTTANWDDVQTVTVTGVNDDVDDGNQAYNIVLAAAVGGGYTGINPADVQVTNADDDTAGVTVSVTGGSTVTTEAGGADTFTVVLTSEPTDDVTIAVSSTETGEGTVSTGLLTFTPANWDTVQTVTVTGVNDFVDDGDNPYTIDLAEASSTDPLYDVIDPQNVSATNTDDDTAGITVTPTSGLTTTEAGGTATFTVVLNSQPTASVTISLSSNDAGEGGVNPISLTFTTANWSSQQTVTVTGVNDQIDDGNVSYQVLLAQATSTDPLYAAINPSDVSVTNNDDDQAGIKVTLNEDPLTTSEGGETATFYVELETQPISDVTLNFVGLPAEGSISPVSITFTTTNWNTPRTVTVTGVNDFLADGSQTYPLSIDAAAGSDPVYLALPAIELDVTNLDDDTPGIFVFPTSGLGTSEIGTKANFNVRLNTQPSAPVTIPLSTSDPSEGLLAVSELIFDSTNWDDYQIVEVTGQNDDVDDGNISYQISVGPSTSADNNYDGLLGASVGITNFDDDTAGITVTQGEDPMVTSETGDTATFQLVLNSEPTANVTIPISSSDTSEGTVSAISIVFSPVNWDVPQTITITGVNDSLADGPQLYSAVIGAASSSDSRYNSRNPADLSVTNLDNDTPGITVQPVSGLETSEGGAADTFTIVLDSQPTSNVSISISSSDPTEGTALPSLLTFTTANWSQPQIVTVTGVDDLFSDGNVVYSILTGAAQSSDTNYSGINPPDVSVTNLDDDTVPISFDDQYDGLEDVNLVVNAPGVLSNDVDPDLGSLQAIVSEDPLHGDLTLNSNGSFFYDPDLNFNGTDHFTYVVFDGGNYSNISTVTIELAAVNDAPTAGGNSYSVGEDGQLIINTPGILSNDNDVDGNPLTVILGTSTQHGELTLNANGAFTYIPDTDYNGPDQFTYRANDGTVSSALATVTITVNSINDVPVGNPDAYISNSTNANPLSVSAPGLLENDFDIEASALTAELADPPGHGTVTIDANGGFIYTPNTGFEGIDQFTYRISDGEDISEEIPVEITIDVTPPEKAIWSLPVNEEGVFNVSSGSLTLEALLPANQDPSEIDYFYFFRIIPNPLDPSTFQVVDIARVYQSPYRATLQVGDLLLGYNQVFVRVYDKAGNGSPLGSPRILVFREPDLNLAIYLPLLTAD